jgi:hypothetical protein
MTPSATTNLRWWLSWIIRFSSVLFGLGVLCVIALTWFAAFYNHDWITVRINKYGERDFELLMWVILGPVFSIGLIATAYNIWLERKDKPQDAIR